MIKRSIAKLINAGISPTRVLKMNEVEIRNLAKKIFLSEQITEMPPKKTYKVGPTGGNLPANRGGYSIRQNPSTKEIMAISNEGEMTERAKNPWAICTAQVGRDNPKKYERCVKSVKQRLKEGQNPTNLFLEKKINRIVERNLAKEISRNQLLDLLEQETKPATKPTTKPTTRPKPKHPGQNPTPGTQPAPKAVKKRRGETNEQSPTTKPAPTKPSTTPSTRPKPKHPGQNPTPGTQPGPKANKEQARQTYLNLIKRILR